MYHKGVAWRGGLATPDGLPSVVSGGGAFIFSWYLKLIERYQK